MRALLLCLWCLCTGLWGQQVTPPANVSAPPLLAGPWVVWHEDGRVRIAVEFPGTASLADLGHVHLRQSAAGEQAGTVISVPRELTTIHRPFSKPSQLMTWMVPPEQAHFRTLELWLSARRQIPVRMPRAPHADSQVHIALVSGRSWPQAEAIKQLEESLAAPLTAVVVDGEGWRRGLGFADWEAEVPIIFAQDGAAEDALRSAMYGDQADWQQGVALGPVVLTPIAHPASAALVLADFTQPWIIPWDRQGFWRLDRLAAPEQRRPGAVAMLLDAAQRFAQPLILSTAEGTGFISDSLVAEDARSVRAEGGGVRYVATALDGAAAVGIPSEVAIPLSQRGMITLSGEKAELRLQVHPASDSTLAPVPIALLWNQRAVHSDQAPTMGWALADGPAAFTRWWDEGENASLPALAWLTLPALRALDLDSSHLRRLLESNETAAELLLRRLTAAEVGLINEWIASLASGAAIIRRDALLRQLADPRRYQLNSFADLFVRSEDPEVVLSALSQARERQSQQLWQLLVARLQRQIAGDLPLDNDPKVQYHLAHGLFDSPFMSPTALRPLAVFVQQHYATSAQPPISRFLERYGRERQD